MSGLMIPVNGDQRFDEQLLPDERVERIFYRLLEVAQASGRKVPDDIEFATYIQPESDAAPAMAMFLVQSLHPKQRFKGQQLRTMGAVPLEAWREAEKDKLHYAGMPDPARNFFARLLREHLEARKNLEELID